MQNSGSVGTNARQRLPQRRREAQVGSARRKLLGLIGMPGLEMQAGVGGFITREHFDVDTVRADAEQGVQRRFLLGSFTVLGGQKGFLRLPNRLAGALALA